MIAMRNGQEAVTGVGSASGEDCIVETRAIRVDAYHGWILSQAEGDVLGSRPLGGLDVADNDGAGVAGGGCHFGSGGHEGPWIFVVLFLLARRLVTWHRPKPFH